MLTFGMQYAIARSPAPVGLPLSRFFAGKAFGVLKFAEAVQRT
ncbi:hypothetical protein ABJI51_02870 [Amycolatopsis sp. NEAU-NG30]|uniref:Uncharacterized protein n=1 Tax=Amycolatopsis melonis TaxID=3156488 RepID=A0ABV0L6S7_9PSEU